MKLITILFFSFFCKTVIAQTNPTAISLPVNEDFGTTAFSTPKPGMASWTGDGARPYTTQAAAEASGPGTDITITAAEPATAGSGGQYGGAVSGNARLSVLQSSNATNGTSQIMMAINTSAASTVTVAYKLTMPVVNPRDIGVALQYRNGISGAFTTVAGTAVVYSNTSTNGGDADGSSDYDSYSFSLPAAAAGQAVVQLRWITWQPSGSGSRSAIAIDDISITSGAAVPCTTPTNQPTALSLTPTITTINGSFTAAVNNPTSYLVVYSTSATLSATPVDGTVYTAGQTLGGGTVVQFSSATSLTISGLTASTLYYVFVFSANNAGCTGGPKYLATTPLTNSVTTAAIPPCTAPTAAPTVLNLIPTQNSVSGNFTASASANRYLVVYSTSATLSANPVNGTTYTSGQALGGGTVSYYSTATSFSQGSLNPNTQYYFFVFAANGNCVGEPVYFTTALVNNTSTLNNNSTGYYAGTANLNCQSLKTALYNIVSTGTTVLSYSPGVWNAYGTTDTVTNFEATRVIVHDMYSHKGPGQNEPYEFVLSTNQCGNYSAEGQCYNREHTVPQSWFNSASPMVSDIHHVVPTDGWVNGQRGNLPFGNVGTATYTSQNGSKKGTCSYPGYSGTVFEPINEFKGDFARMMFYMAVRYENVIASWQNNGTANEAFDGSSYQVFDAWQLKQLYDWHVQDPVSAKEISRNHAVWVIQGNRNPFIDSPQFALRIWNCTGLLSASLPTPSLINITNKCRTEATAKGKVINPPAGATVTVTLDGNAITYTTADSSFTYFTQNVTTPGNHTIRVTFTSGANSSFKDSVYIVTAPTIPTINISGTTTVNTGGNSTISSNITSGGTTPLYQWQDSTSAAGWTNIGSATNATINYTPIATGNKLRCILTGSATGCVNNAPITSNVLTFTVNTTTAISPVNGNNYGIKLISNPIQNTLILTGINVNDKWKTLEIIDINGRKLFVNTNIIQASTLQINVSHFAKGNYTLVLKRNLGKSAYIKFAKM
jgi:endonuclease I